MSGLLVYFGTYTRGESEGIYVADMDTATGALSAPRLAAKTTDPSFVAIHPKGTHLYAVGESSTFRGQRTGAVTAFSIDSQTGALTQLGQVSSGSGGPCHIVVDATGRTALVANYGGGTIASIRIKDSGDLDGLVSHIEHKGSSVNAQRQKEPHAHSINVDAGNAFAVAADLGIDKVLVYKLEAGSGELAPHGETKLAPGSGPRHFAFHSDGKHAFVINELLSTLTAFRWDAAAGTLTETHTITTLPPEHRGNNSTAEVRVHPSGKFVYGSNRGHDSIAVFAFDADAGTLRPVEHEPSGGRTPRNFNLTPDGRFLLAANQGTDNVVVFKVDETTGGLDRTPHEITVGSPVCVRFLRKQ